MKEAGDRTFRLEADELARSALQAQIVQRCRRSLGHDINNALQALQAGIEVLAKSLQPTGGRRIEPEECLPLLKQQLVNLQRTLGRLLNQVAPSPCAVGEFDLVPLVQEVLHFLGHEPAVAHARLELPASARVLASTELTRQILLCSLLDALDDLGTQGSLVFVVSQAPQGWDLTVRVAGANPNPVAVSARRQLVELLQKTLAQESASLTFTEHGLDYTVVLHLPAAVPQIIEKIIETAPALAVSTPTAALRVLIVDDNRDAADSLALLLELDGHSVQAAYSGASALTLLDKYRPTLVVLDIGLPDMSGHEVAQRIRAQLRPAPAIVAVSGYEKDAGTNFDAQLVKPVDLAALRELMARLSAR